MENARQIAEGYTLRGREFVLTDQPLLVNHKGETRQLSDAATSPDGVVYIWKDTSLDPKDVLAHEDFHIAFNRGEKAALEYYDAFISSFDAFDPSYQKAAATINDWYFGGALDLNDLDDLKKVNRELAAYYHQFKENPTLTGLEDFVWVDDFDGMLENSRRTFKESLNLPPDSIGAKKHDPVSYAGMQAEYGTIAPGENAARVVDVPVSTNGTDRVSAGVRTLMEAPQTPDEMIPLYEKAVTDGLFSHDVARDRQVSERGGAGHSAKRLQKELDAWKSLMNDGSAPSKAGIAKGQVLYTLAAENGDTETAMKLAGDLARIATEAGQNLQAQRLLKRMTPEGKLYYAQQTLESFKKELVDQYGSQFGNISIPGELADALMKAGSQKTGRGAAGHLPEHCGSAARHLGGPLERLALPCHAGKPRHPHSERGLQRHQHPGAQTEKPDRRGAGAHLCARRTANQERSEPAGQRRPGPEGIRPAGSGQRGRHSGRQPEIQRPADH